MDPSDSRCLPLQNYSQWVVQSRPPYGGGSDGGYGTVEVGTTDSRRKWFLPEETSVLLNPGKPSSVV